MSDSSTRAVHQPPAGAALSGRPVRRLICASVVCAAGAVYWNALDNPFVYDDHFVIVENPSLTNPTLRGLLLHQMTRPMVNLSYALDAWIWGAAPFGFHLTNVLLHMVNVGLLYLLASRLVALRHAEAPAASPPVHLAAVIAATLFAVHPLMTQAVGYISGRSEVLTASFFLGALLAAARWMRGGHAVWVVAAGGAWGLALATKETAIVFPLIVLVCDRLVFTAPGEWPRVAHRRLHVLMLLVVAVAVAVRLTVFSRLEAADVTPDWRLALLAVEMVQRYLWMLVFPAEQMIFHTVDPIAHALDWRVAAGAATIAGLLVLAWMLRRRAGLASVGLIWFLVVLLPSSALVVVGRAEPIAEHRVYLASCGIFLAAAVGVAALAQRVRRRSARFVLRSSIALLLILLAARTVLRNAVWDDPVALWTEASMAAPDHWLPYVPLGEELHRRGAHHEAVGALANAILLRPEEPAPYGKLGVCLLETGRLDEAAAAFNRLTELAPGSAESLHGQGLVAVARGDYDAGREWLRKAVQRDPANAAARRALDALDARVR